MKKVITYTEEQVTQLKMLLNAVSVTGIQNARQITAIAQVLDSGMPREINEPEESENPSKRPKSHNLETGPLKPSKACTAQNNAVPARTGGMDNGVSTFSCT